jgi:DNA-binding transcriptional LysR family regulator
MNLRQLRAVQTLAELGSVTAAADRLGLTQSAVSRMILALELELGFTLFERHRRRLIPGEHTIHFIAHAERILSGLKELEASTRAIKEKRADRLRIIAVPPFLHAILPRAIARRLAANPNLSVKLDAARRVDVPEWINRRDMDIAVVGLPVDRPEMRVEALPVVRAVVVLPRAHRLADRRRLHMKDVLSGPLLSHASGPLLRLELDRAAAGHGLRPAPVIEASNGWMVCAMVAAGAGLAVMDPFTAAAWQHTPIVIRPLVERVSLRYGVLTFRDQPLVGELKELCAAIQREVSGFLRGSRARP